MIAMQYNFVLPRDYNMQIIDQRITERGPLLDGFPRLAFKAYLSAKTDDVALGSAENLYAPFYLWEDATGLDSFVTGSGFAAVTRDFGWPAVQTWIVWESAMRDNLRDARFASRDVTSIPPHADLGQIRNDAIAQARASLDDGVLAAVTGFNPTTWTMVRFCLLASAPEQSHTPPRGRTLYRVGHLSLPD